jgi:hypothetical protein
MVFSCNYYGVLGCFMLAPNWVVGVENVNQLGVKFKCALTGKRFPQAKDGASIVDGGG